MKRLDESRERVEQRLADLRHAVRLETGAGRPGWRRWLGPLMAAAVGLALGVGWSRGQRRLRS